MSNLIASQKVMQHYLAALLTEDEQTEQDSKIPVLPQVFILSSGEISPFQLLLSENSDLTPLYSAVSTDFAIPLTRSAVSTERP